MANSGELRRCGAAPGSLEELWTSLLQILEIPILIYHTVVSILIRISRCIP
ncbi:hypothetical protein [Bradyrhizobium sp. S3.2.12]|uniref:hypothetical protein n=1 Tax=Bradyrhizobium sp. S3.2.12 TaxID=3156387 RepID=UPI0033963E01